MPNRLNRGLVVGVVALGLAGGAWGYTRAGAADGCGPVDGPIIESQDFTPAELQRSSMDGPLNSGADPLSDFADLDVPQEVDGLPLWWVDSVMTDGHLSEGIYYLDAPVGSMLGSEFVDAGGVQLSRESVSEGSYTIAYVLSWLGERAVPVDVGSHAGALVWAEPDHTGTRTHRVYWSDGAFNYRLNGDRSAEEILTLGRSLVCAA